MELLLSHMTDAGEEGPFCNDQEHGHECDPFVNRVVWPEDTNSFAARIEYPE